MPWDTDADGGQALAEFAGRACYQSWTKPNPATATNGGYLRHILEVGHLSVLEHGTRDLLPHRRLALAHPRADPAPALLLLAAVPALRARAERRDGRAGGHRRGPGAAREVRRGRATPRSRPTPSCSRGWRRSSPTSSTPPCAASRRARPPARCCRTPPRPGSSSPATTARGGTSSRCAPPSTPTSRSARWPSRACASCKRVAPQRVRRLRDQRPARRHGDRLVATRHRGLSGPSAVDLKLGSAHSVVIVPVAAARDEMTSKEFAGARHSAPRVRAA